MKWKSSTNILLFYLYRRKNQLHTYKQNCKEPMDIFHRCFILERDAVKCVHFMFTFVFQEHSTGFSYSDHKRNFSRFCIFYNLFNFHLKKMFYKFFVFFWLLQIICKMKLSHQMFIRVVCKKSFSKISWLFLNNEKQEDVL